MCKANHSSFNNGSQTVHKQATIYKATDILSNSRITLTIKYTSSNLTLINNCKVASIISNWRRFTMKIGLTAFPFKKLMQLLSESMWTQKDWTSLTSMHIIK